MNFKAKQTDLTLNLTGHQNEDGTENKKTFSPSVRITASYAEDILKGWNDYFREQKKVPEENQDSINDGYLSTMEKVYEGLDKDWIKENFLMEQIKDMFEFMVVNLRGAKKNG